MIGYIQTLVDFITAHSSWAGPIIFIVALSESLVFVGLFVPGSAIIVAAAMLIPAGTLNLWSLLGWSIAGAVIGDAISYWLGVHYRRSISKFWPFSRRPELLERGIAFFERHGTKSVFLGRFFGPVRATIPLVAGILAMPAPRFYAANILSALLWAPALILPGALLGFSFDVLGAVTWRLVLLVLLVMVLGAVAVWAVRHFLRVGLPILVAMQGRIWLWTREHDSRASRLIAPLIDPNRPETKILLLLAIVLVVAGRVLVEIIEDVANGEEFARTDRTLHVLLQELRTPWTDHVMVAATQLGDSTVALGVVSLALIWLAWRRAWRAAFYLLAAVGLAEVLVATMKLSLQVARPTSLYTGISAFSFPSGHATVNLALYGFLLILVLGELRLRWHALITSIAVLLVTLIALSRLYLSAHWLSDVAGGLAFGATWIAILGISYWRHKREAVGAIGLTVTVAVGLALVGGWHGYTAHAAGLQQYAGRPPEFRMLTLENWTETSWQDLPARRVDLEGKLEQPLTIQWAGSLDTLRDRFGAGGWGLPPRWTLSTAAAWLGAERNIQAFPVLPLLHNGHQAVLTLVQPAGLDGRPNRRLVLRFWPTTQAVFDPSESQPVPLWVGGVAEEALQQPLPFFSVPIEQGAASARQTFASVVALLPNPHLVRRAVPVTDHGWDGQVVLSMEAR